MHMLDSISTAINWRWDFDRIIQRSWIALSSVILCHFCCIARKLLLPMSESTIQDLARLTYAPKVFMKLHQKVLLYRIHKQAAIVYIYTIAISYAITESKIQITVLRSSEHCFPHRCRAFTYRNKPIGNHNKNIFQNTFIVKERWIIFLVRN